MQDFLCKIVLHAGGPPKLLDRLLQIPDTLACQIQYAEGVTEDLVAMLE